jgi:hypothetical protein
VEAAAAAAGNLAEQTQRLTSAITVFKLPRNQESWKLQISHRFCETEACGSP